MSGVTCSRARQGKEGRGIRYDVLCVYASVCVCVCVCVCVNN